MKDLDKRVRQLERILALNVEIVSNPQQSSLLTKIAQTAAELTESESASILLLDDRTGDLRFCAAATEEITPLLSRIPVPVTHSIAGKVLQEREPAVVHDVRADPRHFREVGQAIGFETRSLLAVPLQVQERCIGVLEAVNKRSGLFTEEDKEILTILAAQAAVAIENARLVEALQEAHRKLQELDRLKSDFITIASHELRTPLSLVLGYASLLQEQQRGSREVEGVLRAAVRLQHIIETMVNLQYLETGELPFRYEEFNLGEEILLACQTHAPLAEASGLTLDAVVPQEPIWIRADREKIRLVLDNLLSNAIKFTPAGGRVRVKLEERYGNAEITVTDTGVGIPQKDLDRIFERFYQVESPMTRRRGGLGLGLPIVREIVEKHGGRVWAESVLGQGSRFIVRLPLASSR